MEEEIILSEVTNIVHQCVNNIALERFYLKNLVFNFLKKLSLHLMMNHGEGVSSSSNLGSTQTFPSLGVWMFLVQLVTAPVGHRLNIKRRQQNLFRRLWEEISARETCLVLGCFLVQSVTLQILWIRCIILIMVTMIWYMFVDRSP